MGVHSINLSKRNESVYKKFFKTKGRNGMFSAWINDQMNKGFTLDGIEHLKQQLKDNQEGIHKLEEQNEALVKKLRILIDKKEQVK